jgi:hypothetical protein
MKILTLKAEVLSGLLLLAGIFVYGQVPQGFNYQAIARDGNNPITTSLPVRITVQSEENGGAIWVELHASVTPDESGLFSLVIGTGERLAESTVASFSDINWGISPKYIKTEIYSGTWLTMGASKLWAVPYAMVAKSAFSGITNPFTTNGDTILFSGSVSIGADNLYKAKLAVKGDKIITSEDALFEVKRSDGQTVFAVYNEGIRMNVADRPAKGAKGGFAVGGFGTAKTGEQEFFSITPYSARINMNAPLPGKGAKGGFAIGGFGGKSGTIPTNFMDITPENYFIGHESGINITDGLYNSFIGYQAGYNTTTGRKNYFIGYKAGFSNTTGYSNTFIGDSAGYQNTTGYFNSFLGNWAGYNNTDGFKNTIIGHRAGFSNSSGICNVFIGPDAGGKNSTAWYNTFVGIGAGYNTTAGGYNSYYGINSGYAMTSGVNNAFFGSNSGYWFDGGSGNTFIGAEAGRGGPDNDPADPVGNYNTVVGSFSGTVLENAFNNVFLGAYAGKAMRTGTGNVFVGYKAGYRETGSNKLYIANSSSNAPDPVTPPLIYGDFALDRIGLGTITPAYKLDVVGDINISSGSSFRINGTAIAPSQWATATNGIWYNSGIGINTEPDATNQLKVEGNVVVSGDVQSNTVTGNLNGKVNDLTMGRIFLTGSGVIAETGGSGGDFTLTYDKDTDQIILINKSETSDCFYRCLIQKLATPEGKNGTVGIGPSSSIIMELSSQNDYGLEIHFGMVDATTGWCSVWLEKSKDTFVGHYIKY